jgi:mycothiol synthase
MTGRQTEPGCFSTRSQPRADSRGGVEYRWRWPWLTVTIGRVDVVPLTTGSPEEHLDGWSTLFRDLYAEQVPEVEPPDRRFALAELCGDDDQDITAILALCLGEPVGTLVAQLPRNEDLDRANVAVFVCAGHRGKGVGRRLVDAASPTLRDGGRTVLRGEAEPGTDGDRFAAALGAGETQRVVRSRLDLTAVRTDDLERLSQRQVPGYRIVTWDDRCPDDLVEEFGRARTAMNDAPHGAAERDPWSWDAGRVRNWEGRQQRRGCRGWVTAAVHEETGAVAGFTEIYAWGTEPRGVEQEDTAVVAAHRGNGLGLLMKAVNLRRLRAAEPHTRWVVTWNAADNRFMRSVNERLGFVPSAEEVELELSLG